MPSFKRKVGQGLQVGDSSVYVVKVSGSYVTLRVAAPDSVRVYRLELITKGKEDEDHSRDLLGRGAGDFAPGD